MPSNTERPQISTNAVDKSAFASRRLFSPKRLATSAEIATLIARNTDNPINFGCAVSPTAATAFEPSALTMSESISPANATKNDSIIAGTAIFIAVRIVRLLYFFIMYYSSLSINCIYFKSIIPHLPQK